MDSLPQEILRFIGEKLDGRALINAMQTNRRWHDAFMPIAWHTIRIGDWHNPLFPIQQAAPEEAPQGQVEETQEREDKDKNELKQIDEKDKVEEKLVDGRDKIEEEQVGESSAIDRSLWRNLLQVRRLSWSSNSALKFQDPLTEIPLSRLRDILGMTPMLKELSLRARMLGPGEELLEAIRQLGNLRSFKANMELGNQGIKVPIKNMFKLLSRLDDLTLAGDWYTPPPSTNDTVKWNMRRLSANRDDIKWILPHCQDLLELGIVLSSHSDWRIQEFSLAPIINCTKLRKLHLPNAARFEKQTDVVKTITKLTDLRSLTYSVTSAKHVGFLCKDRRKKGNRGRSEEQEGVTDGVDYRLALPHLEHLVIELVEVSNTQKKATHEYIADVLQSRTQLKTLAVSDCPIQMSVLLANPWSCSKLEELRIGVAPLRRLTRTEESRRWNSFFRRIGCLTRLKSLRIDCMGLVRDPGNGFVHLAGATSLRSLTLSDDHNTMPVWTLSELEDLLDSVPTLERLDLRPIANYQDVRGWIDESEWDVIFM
ncbi:hypothetical protein BGX29_007101 [Mortierella sp. GBA35]|nr:hypothetical protein BGX29_007101 [Mortierella sp. GBA35]